MILVTGATGNVGRALVDELDSKGASFRILVRDPARVIRLPKRAEVVVGDLGDPATVRTAMAGIDGLFLLTPGIGTTHTSSAANAAVSAGVSHIVLLSSFNVLGDPMPAMGRWHYEHEEIVRATDIPATILRPSGFMTNALEWVTTIQDGGFVLDPIGPGRQALIDPMDIAAVAALALSEDGHLGKEYLLTGGEALTVSELVGIIAKTIGRAIEVREATSPEEALQFRYPNGAPEALADALIEGLTLMRADTMGIRNDTVELLLGRNPHTFATWCRRNADAFKPPTPSDRAAYRSSD